MQQYLKYLYYNHEYHFLDQFSSSFNLKIQIYSMVASWIIVILGMHRHVMLACCWLSTVSIAALFQSALGDN